MELVEYPLQRRQQWGCWQQGMVMQLGCSISSGRMGSGSSGSMAVAGWGGSGSGGNSGRMGSSRKYSMAVAAVVAVCSAYTGRLPAVTVNTMLHRQHC